MARDGPFPTARASERTLIGVITDDVWQFRQLKTSGCGDHMWSYITSRYDALHEHACQQPESW